MTAVFLVPASVPAAMHLLEGMLGGFVFILIAGLGGFSLWRSPSRIKRIFGFALLALAIGGGVTFAQTVCFPCYNCDPWWLQMFGICI